MAWNKNITTNQRSLGKVILTLFIGTAITSCAGTNSSVQKKGEENPNLIKAGTPVADSLAEGMPEFARSVFKGVLDSVPGEYYYYTSNGRIDTLFQKEGDQYKAIVSIAYDFLIGLNNFELKKGNYSYTVKEGVLVGEEDFPSYYKGYWDNGKLKGVMTGLLYKDDQGDTWLDSGHLDMYSENGKILEQSDWKNKQPIAYKVWNENGVLIEELDFPTFFKGYWDNGKSKNVLTGILYRDDQGRYELDSGHSEIYFENGKTNQQNDWKDKQLISQKEWNENGALVKEIVFPKFFKEYWDNGKLKGLMTGLLYRDDQGNFFLNSGHSDTYYENGEIYQQGDWKDKRLVTSKIWNEKGVLTQDIDISKHLKTYWDNGKPKVIATGILYENNQGGLSLDSGHSETYFENGKISLQNDWKDKKVVTQKKWNENGVLTSDLIFPKYAQEYWDNGKPKKILTGLLYKDDEGNIQIDSGCSEDYFENGKINQQSEWKDKTPIASKQWNEKGILIIDFKHSKYAKEYWNNGKPKQILTGLLYKNDQGTFLVDSGHAETYFENGKINQQNDWKDKLLLAQKEWNKNGVLVKEWAFPKYFKEYWDNGKPKQIMTGLLYRNDQGIFLVDSGHTETYFKNGKINQQNDWKDKRPVASKQWNENGVLTIELDFPKHFKQYWDNGKPKVIATGRLYNDQGNFPLDSGHSETYFENGKIRDQKDWKNKQLVASKVWNENGVMTSELDFPRSLKNYWDNGKISQIATGILYRDDQGGFSVDSGHSEIYFENGKIQKQNDWKGKQLVVQKGWNENGVLTKEFAFPKYAKEYWDNGKLKGVMTGLLYKDDQGNFVVDSGRTETFFENGRINLQTDGKNKMPVAHKQWNENGTLTKEYVFPKYYKEYWDDGKPKIIMEGLLYRDNQGNFEMDRGHSEIYFETGKIREQKDWKNKVPVAGKVWNESGVLMQELVFPKYCKKYWDNGKLKEVSTGILSRDNQGKIHMVSGHTEIYFENGKINVQAEAKNNQLIARKKWNENGVLIEDIDFPKHLKEYWDNGKPKSIGIGTLYRDNQGNIHMDSGRSELYFENGKIYQHNHWKDKLLIAQKEWNENGALIKDVDFPKYYKEYLNDGNPLNILTGLLYRDDQGNIKVDSGYSDIYFENGKIYQHNHWKDKLLIAQKEWNENGVLTKDIDFPNYSKTYWDNGKLKEIGTGLLCRDNQGLIRMNNGHSETYFENGKIKEQSEWKDKQLIANKGWSDNGTLTIEMNIPEGYLNYYDTTGALIAEVKGFKGFTDENKTRVENGHIKYYNNGKLQVQLQYKEKNMVSQKIWREDGSLSKDGDAIKGFHKEYFPNGKLSREVAGKFHYDEATKEIILEKATDKQWYENGNLSYEAVFPEYEKYYFGNGALRNELEGTLYYDDKNSIQVQDGFRKSYFDNGKTSSHRIYKEKKIVGLKTWNRNGDIEKEGDVLREFHKEFFSNGKISVDVSGKFLYSSLGFSTIMENGSKKQWYKNGKLASHKIYKERRLVGKTEWHEDGNTSISVELPNHYKEFYDNGKIKVEATGTIVEKNESFKIKDGIYKEYSPSGEVTYSATYKDFQIISEKK